MDAYFSELHQPRNGLKKNYTSTIPYEGLILLAPSLISLAIIWDYTLKQPSKKARNQSHQHSLSFVYDHTSQMLTVRSWSFTCLWESCSFKLKCPSSGDVSVAWACSKAACRALSSISNFFISCNTFYSGMNKWKNRNHYKYICLYFSGTSPLITVQKTIHSFDT